MQKILFTKKINDNIISTLNNFEVESKDFIQVKTMTISPYDIEGKSVIFTSLNGVNSFFKNGFQLKLNQKIYGVGEKTEKHLNSLGFQSIRTEKNAEQLKLYLKENAKDEKFLHFGSDLSIPIFRNNTNYQQIPVYKTELLFPKITDNYDIIVFFSPSGVRSFIQNNAFQNEKIFSIGKTTTKEIEKYTKKAIFTSSKNTLKDVVSMIKKIGMH